MKVSLLIERKDILKQTIYLITGADLLKPEPKPSY
jgi:hypothetical protein